MPDAIWRYVFDWVPFFVFIGFLIFFLRRLKSQTNEARQYRIEHMAEMRRHTDLLERIARALEQRPPA